MDRTDCIVEKISSRTIGIIMVPVALVIGVIGGLVLPVFGFFFALPILLLAGIFIAAPQSRVCRLLTGRGEKPDNAAG